MKRFVVEKGKEVYYEVIDTETGDMVDRLSTYDVSDSDSTLRKTVRCVRSEAYALARKLNKNPPKKEGSP